MKPSVYYATPIRGPLGANAPIDYMSTNCKRAKQNLNVLQVIYPEIEWVAVAPHDIVVQRLLAYGMVDISNVLAVDFDIGDGCNGLLCHLWEKSGGALAEYERQLQFDKPCCTLQEDGVFEIWKIRDWYILDTFVEEILSNATE